MSGPAGAGVELERTVPVPVEEAWRLITDARALGRWLGGWTPVIREGQRFTTVNGSTGTVEAVEAPRLLRLRWTPALTDQETVVDLTVDEGEGGATIRVRHEHLADDPQRKLMRAFWSQALENLADRLSRDA